MTKYFLPGLTKAQADALDRSGCGDFTLSGVSPKTLKKLLDDQLTDDELILMLEFFKAEVFATQNHERGDASEKAARFRTWISL
jgi:hypothetical protein